MYKNIQITLHMNSDECTIKTKYVYTNLFSKVYNLQSTEICEKINLKQQYKLQLKCNKTQCPCIYIMRRTDITSCDTHDYIMKDLFPNKKKKLFKLEYITWKNSCMLQ